MALILAGVLVAQYLVYRSYGLSGVEYKLGISKTEAFEGEEIEIIETIENNKWLPLPWARSEISCSRWLTFYGGAQNIGKDSQKGLVSGIFMLKGRQKLRRVWRVRCEKRGEFRINNVTLSVSDLFGLCKPSVMIALSQSITVLPSPSDMVIERLSAERFIGDNPVERFILPDPFAICGAKEYTGREPMNRIHWQQTAKTGSLMAYNNEFTTERSLLIVFNLQRTLSDEKIRLSVTVLEAQIKAAAFVMDYCYKNHIVSAFAVNSVEECFIAADDGYQHTIDVLRALAKLKNQCGIHIDEFAENLDYSDYTDVLFISNVLSDNMSELMQRLRYMGKYTALLSCEAFESEKFDVYHVPRTRNYPMESGEDI